MHRDVLFLLRQLALIEHEQDRAGIREIAERYGIDSWPDYDGSVPKRKTKGPRDDQESYSISVVTVNEFDLSVSVWVHDESGEAIDIIYETDSVDDARDFVTRVGGFLIE